MVFFVKNTFLEVAGVEEDDGAQSQARRHSSCPAKLQTNSSCPTKIQANPFHDKARRSEIQKPCRWSDITDEFEETYDAGKVEPCRWSDITDESETTYDATKVVSCRWSDITDESETTYDAASTHDITGSDTISTAGSDTPSIAKHPAFDTWSDFNDINGESSEMLLCTPRLTSNRPVITSPFNGANVEKQKGTGAVLELSKMVQGACDLPVEMQLEHAVPQERCCSYWSADLVNYRSDMVSYMPSVKPNISNGRQNKKKRGKGQKANTDKEEKQHLQEAKDPTEPWVMQGRVNDDGSKTKVSQEAQMVRKANVDSTPGQVSRHRGGANFAHVSAQDPPGFFRDAQGLIQKRASRANAKKDAAKRDAVTPGGIDFSRMHTEFANYTNIRGGVDFSRMKMEYQTTKNGRSLAVACD